MSEKILKLGLFGYPTVSVDGSVIDKFVTKRAEALFYYLVVTRRTHSRDVLAALFWPDMEEPQGKKNLRTALPVLRKLFGDYLLISRDAVAFNEDLPFALDTDVLETAVSTYQPSGDIEILETAVAGYKGSFLEGFHIDNAPEFDNWIFAQGEYWRGVFVQGLHLLAAHYLRQRHYTKGLATTTRLLEIEPWSESAYRQQMLLFAYNQQRSAALKTYEQCQQALKEAFDIDPMVETIALYQRIRAEETNGGETATPLHNLPREMTPFVGRTEELRQIREKALNPRYPLLTIVGEGGMGKSRVALTAVQQLLYDFPEGVWFVPLIGVSSSLKEGETETALALAIAQALQIPLSASDPITDQVINYLQGKKLLLALDNMEHLIEGTGFVLQILRQAKQVQLIITSRRRLNVQVETVFRLHGLPTPDATIAQAETDGVAYALAHSSVQLFVERARRVRPELALAAQNVEPVSQICRLVAGLPLGIELAAALVEQQQCAEIAVQIEQDANQLATDMRDLPPHHRSVWALFDYSWQLLAAHERAVLAQCSVFAGGFMLEAATAVAQATETELTNLVHQSLLTRDNNGRYSIHPLVQQFSRQKHNELIQPAYQLAATRQRHRTYYLQTNFADYAGIWNTSLSQLQAESNNKQVAWRNAIQAHDFTLLADEAVSWVAFWERLSVFPEAIVTLREALQTIEGAPLSEDNADWLASLQIELAGLLVLTGNYQEATDLVENILQITPSPHLLGQAYRLQCILMWAAGDLDKAELALEQALGYKDALSPFAYANLLRNQATLRGYQGNQDEEKRLLEESLAITKQHNFVREKILALSNLGVAYQYDEQRYRAIQYYEQAYEVSDAIGYMLGKAYILSNLTTTYIELGLYDEAADALRKAVALSQNSGTKQQQTEQIVCQACLYNAFQQYDDAVEKSQEALESFAQLDNASSMVWAYQILGSAWSGKAEWEQAKEVYEKLRVHCQSLPSPEGELEALSGLAFVAYQQGDRMQMCDWVEQALAMLPKLVKSHSLINNRMDVYWRCYVVLDHLGDDRAAGVLETAVSQLQTQAEQITDSAVRKQFLDNIQSHQELMRVAG